MVAASLEECTSVRVGQNHWMGAPHTNRPSPFLPRQADGVINQAAYPPSTRLLSKATSAFKKTLVECSVENANCVQFNYNKCYLIFPSIWKRDFNQQWRDQCNWSNTREPFLHFTGQVKPCPHFSSNLSVDLCTMILSYVNFTPPLSPLAICWQNSMINWHWASFAKVLIENYPPCS